MLQRSKKKNSTKDDTPQSAESASVDSQLDLEDEGLASTPPLGELEASSAKEVIYPVQNAGIAAEEEDFTNNLSASDVFSALQDDTIGSAGQAKTTASQVAPQFTAVSESGRNVQSTIASFYQAPEKYQDGPDNAITRIEDGVNKILLKMDAMNITDNQRQIHSTAGTECVGAEDVKAAKNLVELANCSQISVEILVDGCRVTCIPCQEYIRANSLMKR